MALPASDGFGSGSDQSLTSYSANWTITNSTFRATNSNSGSAYANNSSSRSAACWTADTFPDNQYAEIVYALIQGSGDAGPAVRCSNSAFTCYTTIDGAAGNASLRKYVSGASTTLSSATVSVSNGDTLRLEVSGSTLTTKKNGSTSGMPSQQTDSAITSGYAGMTGFGGSGVYTYINSWAAGSLSQTYTQSLSGAISSAGAIKRTATKVLAGAISSAGALTKGIQYSLSLIGGMNPLGALANLKAYGRAFSGAVTSSGVVTRSTTKILAGAVTSAGVVMRTATKLLSGVVTSAGAATLTTTKVLAGAISSAGALTLGRLYSRAFSGAISSAGALARTYRGYTGLPSAARTATVRAVGRVAEIAASVRTALIERGERVDEVER